MGDNNKYISKEMSLKFLILYGACCTVVSAQTDVIRTQTVTTHVSPIDEINPPTETTTYTTTTTTVRTRDEEIVSNIYARYAREPALTGTQLTVGSRNGIITINGTVTAQSQADEAVNEALAVAGVKDVRSNIQVITNPDVNRPYTQRLRLPNY